jgi:hypothetical protein
MDRKNELVDSVKRYFLLFHTNDIREILNHRDTSLSHNVQIEWVILTV